MVGGKHMGRRIKVAMITPGTFPIPGVKSSSIEMLVEKLANLIQEEADVFIFGTKFRKQLAFEQTGAITFYRYPKQEIAYIDQVIAELQELEPDIIQIENRPRFARAVRLAMPEAKIILVMQSTLFLSRPHIGREELHTCLEAADLIVVNSQYLKDYLLQEFNGSSSKITVNHLGVDIDQFRPKWHQDEKDAAELLKKEWGVSDKKILLYVGRLVELKGVHHILKAMPEIIKWDPSIVLFIAGSPLSPTSSNLEYVAKLEKLAEKVKEHVIFTQFIPHDEIHKWFQMADLLVVPSAAEPFGLVNVEAMAVGTPVIATHSGGIPEIIENGKTGILIQPERMHDELVWKIVSLFMTPATLMKMGVESVMKVKAHFTWSHTAQRQLALYRKLTNDHK
jgi:spore coat protein SA